MPRVHHDHSNMVFTGGFDNRVMVEGFAALALPLGYPDQSAARLEGSLRLARELESSANFGGGRAHGSATPSTERRRPLCKDWQKRRWN